MATVVILDVSSTDLHYFLVGEGDQTDEVMLVLPPIIVIPQPLC